MPKSAEIKETPPTIHMICGYIAVGKTTFAKKLAQCGGTLYLSIDSYMRELYQTDPSCDDFLDCLHRVENLMCELSAKILSLRVNVVYDHGFWTREFRDRVRVLAKDVGASSKLYYLSCPDTIALRRLLSRNQHLDSDTFMINETTFANLKHLVEPLDPDESYEFIDTSTL